MMSCSGSRCGGVLSRFGHIFQPILLLLLRLVWGLSFAFAGWQKFNGIAATASYFGSLGILFPTFTAYLVSLIELIGGAFLVAGFLTRLACIPLFAVMLGAFFTAHKEATLQAFSDTQTFFSQPPLSFTLVLLVLFAFGPGCISLDAFFSWLRNKISGNY